MAGINRLGKAPPKPGTLRPPDPNKYRTVDMFSEGAEGDADYMRMVQDIEDMQQQQGWLFGRGAFDKGDLLYLRDEAEKQRHAELELRDSEKTQFAALRAKFEKQEGQGDVIRIARKDRTGGRSQPELIANLVRVKSQAPDANTCAWEGSPDAKRPKTSDGKQVKLIDSSKAVVVVTSSKCEVAVNKEEATKINPDNDSRPQDKGLGVLLGNYTSSSEDGEDERKGSDEHGGPPNSSVERLISSKHPVSKSAARSSLTQSGSTRDGDS